MGAKVNAITNDLSLGKFNSKDGPNKNIVKPNPMIAITSYSFLGNF